MAGRYRYDGMNWLSVLLCGIFACGFLPVTECNYEALYDYEREKNVDLRASYIVDDEVKDIELNQPIYFYGQSYSLLRVTKDGTVSFGGDVVSFKPSPQWPKGFTALTSSSDKPFIAAFHYDGYNSANPQTYHGRLYCSKYERKKEDELTEDTKRYQSFLDSLGKYLSHSSVTVTSFRPHVYVMITWENVTNHATRNAANISCTADNNHPCPSATFQLVIVADSKNTFAIFNFAKMDLPYSKTHLAGMNGGHGRGWTDVVKCQGTCRKTKQYRRIPHLLSTLQGSSSDGQDHVGLSMSSGGGRPSTQVLGRFIFVVTDDIIVRGGCLPHGIKGAGYMDTVEAWPQQVGMLGGDIIKVSGQCQAPYSTIYCRFDLQEVTKGKISAGMVGWCPVPRLSVRGHVRLEVSSDPNDWRVFTHVVALPPDHVGRLSDQQAMQPWFTVNPTRLSLTWNGTQLTSDFKATVDIVLVQYRETGDKVAWKDLVKLAEAVPNSGSFHFDPNSDDERYRCRDSCDDIELGVVEVRLTEDYLEGATEKQYIVVGPVPLAWYVSAKKTEDEGSEWYQDHCQHWAHRERASQDHAWRAELPPCPCTLQQALADWGRFQADVSCSQFDKGSKCAFNQGAKHCVRSVQPTAKAAGSHCCYDNDDNLMYAADSYQGSTCSKAHPWGATPYSRPGHVPALSHWLHDLIPYYYCCQWSSEDYCYLYTEQRPTADCRYYDPPGAAAIYGDPYVRTFDDEQYQFGGAGDFWLVHSPGLSLQARFMERQTSTVVHTPNKLLPTYISSLAVRGVESSDIVTFTLAPPDDLHPRRLDVQVNDLHYFFDTPRNMWQDFTGLYVVNNEKYGKAEEDRYHSNFTVLLESGAGVQVAERHGLLHVVVLLPPLIREEGHSNRKPKSKGLLGSWDERKTNEFMTPDGNYVPSTENDFTKYKDFALKWAVADDGKQSLFRFNHPVSDRYPYTDSISNHLDPDHAPGDGEVSSVCGTSERNFKDPCAYHYYVTGIRTLAIDTRAATEAFDSLRRSQRKIWSCGWLSIPLAIKDHNSYVAGSRVRVTGCRRGRDSSGEVQVGGSTRGGPTEYQCVQNETEHQPFWDPYDDINHSLCIDDVEEASLAMIIGIAVAVCVVIIIVVIVACILFKKRRTRKERVSKRRGDADKDPGADETLVKRKPRDEGAIPMNEQRQLSV